MRARCPIMRRRFRWRTVTALVIRQNIAVLYEKEGDFAKALEQFNEQPGSWKAGHTEVREGNPFSGKPVNIGGNTENCSI